MGDQGCLLFLGEYYMNIYRLREIGTYSDDDETISYDQYMCLREGRARVAFVESLDQSPLNFSSFMTISELTLDEHDDYEVFWYLGDNKWQSPSICTNYDAVSAYAFYARNTKAIVILYESQEEMDSDTGEWLNTGAAKPKKPEKTFKKVYKPASMVNVGHFDATKVLNGGNFISQFYTGMGPGIWEAYNVENSKILIVTEKEFSDILSDPKPIYMDYGEDSFKLNIYVPDTILKSDLRKGLVMPIYHTHTVMYSYYGNPDASKALFIMTQEIYDTLKSMS